MPPLPHLASSDVARLPIGTGRPTQAGVSTTANPELAEDPVARVVVDTGLAHLDRPFDYLVPASMADSARPGVRVKVRFAGQERDGFIIERALRAEHAGRLQPLRRVVSPEPVLTPAVLAAARSVATIKAGSIMDILRLAVPPRHAAAEKALNAAEGTLGADDPAGEPRAGSVDGIRPLGSGTNPWAGYPAGAALLDRLSNGESPGASWLALPGSPPDTDWPAALAQAVVATLAGGRGALIVVPDQRDVDRLDAALATRLGQGRHVRLTANQGPHARYTAFLKVLRGQIRVVIGTRSAAFAPVAELGLVAWWDDGDDLHDEPRAPYPHVREILLARAGIEGAAVISGGFVRTSAVELLRQEGVLADVAARPAVARAALPRIELAGEGSDRERDPAGATGRLPSRAWRLAKDGLACGPVLVQVPRRGYLPSLACQDCRRAARCPRCGGPLGMPSRSGPPRCRWCATAVDSWQCHSCGGTRLRARIVGAGRTSEELGRAFPGVPIHTSGAGEVLAGVGSAPALVIATPGAEPLAEGGYAAALLLDAWALLERPALDAGEEALRRWAAACALVRPSTKGGRVLLVGATAEESFGPVQALLTWRPSALAERELAAREEVGLPPARRVAVLEGDRNAVASALGTVVLPPGCLVLRPQAPVDGRDEQADRDEALWAGASGHGSSTAVVMAAREVGEQFEQAWRAVRAVRSARKEPGKLTIRLDPAHLDA
ncbi:MAG: primosomal protein N' [Nostocoides sp.]